MEWTQGRGEHGTGKGKERDKSHAPLKKKFFRKGRKKMGKGGNKKGEKKDVSCKLSGRVRNVQLLRRKKERQAKENRPNVGGPLLRKGNAP